MHGATTTLAKMGLTVTLEAGRDACADSIVGFLGAVDGLSEHALLDVSRCYGWARLDVVVHVVAGWQEMLGGMVATVDAAPTVDAATYWPAFAKEFATDDEVPTLMSQRRRTAIHTRPSTAVAQLHDVGAALLHGVRSFEDRPRLWQGHVFTAGDYLAVWAVENVVHELDLGCDHTPAPRALTLARATIEAILEEPLPTSWTDAEATLIGTGRVPAPDPASALVGRLPALG